MLTLNSFREFTIDHCSFLVDLDILSSLKLSRLLKPLTRCTTRCLWVVAWSFNTLSSKRRALLLVQSPGLCSSETWASMWLMMISTIFSRILRTALMCVSLWTGKNIHTDSFCLRESLLTLVKLQCHWWASWVCPCRLPWCWVCCQGQGEACRCWGVRTTPSYRFLGQQARRRFRPWSSWRPPRRSFRISTWSPTGTIFQPPNLHS